MRKHEWKDKIAIGGWVTPWPKRLTGKEYITAETYRDVKACGIDFLHTLYENGNSEEFLQALDCAEEAGIFLYIHDDRFFKGEFSPKEGREWIEKLSEKKSFLGLNVKDEPCSNDFANLKNIVETYQDECESYINLLPVYAIGTQLVDGIWKIGREATEAEYESYLTAFLDAVPVNVLSYDFYPFKNKTFGSLDERYFYQLYISKKMADERGIPLWNFVQVTSFNPDVRVMTENEIFWCVTTSIAFGVTGLQYFTYFTPFDCGSETFMGAIIDENGEKTPRYMFAKSCNAHINALGDTLLGASFKGVMALGEYTELIPAACKLASFGDLETVTGRDYIVGCFEKESRSVYYAVNSSLEKAEELTLTFRTSAKRGIVENGEKTTSEGQSVTFTLLPGRAVLICE